MQTCMLQLVLTFIKEMFNLVHGPQRIDPPGIQTHPRYEGQYEMLGAVTVPHLVFVWTQLRI